jgi:hypothetical protein
MSTKRVRLTRVSATEIKTEILECVRKGRNLTPSEIVTSILALFPAHTYYEMKFLIKEMQKDQWLVHDIIYGGLRVA